MKNICNKHGVQVYYKGGNTIKGHLMAPKDKDHITKKSGILEDSGSAENKEILLFSNDKLLLASILRPLHQVTKEMLV